MGASASRYTITKQPSDDRGKSGRNKLPSNGETKVVSAASSTRKKRHSSRASSRPATGSTTRRHSTAGSAGSINRVAKSNSRNSGSRGTPVDDFNTDRRDRVRARDRRQQSGGGGGSSGSDRSRQQATNGAKHQASWSFGGHRLAVSGNDTRGHRAGTISRTFHSAGTVIGGRPRRDSAAAADTWHSNARPVSLPAAAHRSAMSTGGVPPKQDRNWLGFRRNRGAFSGFWDVVNRGALAVVCFYFLLSCFVSGVL